MFFFLLFWALVKHFFNSLVTRLVNMWRRWTGPVALCLAETLCIVCSSPPQTPKRWVEQRGCWSFFSGASAHIFCKGWNESGEAKRVLKSYPFLKKKNSVYYMFVVCDFPVYFFLTLSMFYLLKLFIIMLYPSCYCFYFLGIDHFHICFPISC